jgi:hypothetical protein
VEGLFGNSKSFNFQRYLSCFEDVILFCEETVVLFSKILLSTRQIATIARAIIIWHSCLFFIILLNCDDVVSKLLLRVCVSSSQQSVFGQQKQQIKTKEETQKFQQQKNKTIFLFL